MAKKPLIFVGIEGELPHPLPKRGFILSKEKALLPFGTVRRKENDHVKALDLALQIKDPQRKVFVTEKAVEFDLNAPRFDWEEIAPEEFTHINPNHIQVSTNIASTYKKYFDFEVKDDLHLLTQPKTTKQRLRGLTASYSQMVGRQKELTELKEILEQSFEDRGQMASIIGDGGMGKTRLWVEFEKYLENEHVLYFHGTFSQQSEVNYSAFREIFVPFVEHFQEKFTLSEPQKAILDYILYPEQDNEFVRNLSPEDLDQNTYQLARTLLEQVKDEKIAFILDDIHWSDEKSRKLIEFLVPLVPKQKHMWLLIHRPDYKPTFDKELFYHQIKLQALDVDQIETQIKNMLELKYIAPSTLEKIHDHSKGNPFFVEEIFRHSIENKDIGNNEDIIQNLPLDTGIPMNIQSMVQTRLDNLDTTLFEALKLLSVMGAEIYYEEAKDLLTQKGYQADDVINELLNESYLTEISAFPEHKIGFYHDIIFESLQSENISDKELVEFNKTITEFLIGFYKEDINKHIARICDHAIKTPFKNEHKKHFEKAAEQAFAQNNFHVAKKYYKYLHSNNALEKKCFSNYFSSLNNTKDFEKLEDFLNYWDLNTTIKEEDPSKGYYYLRAKYLLERRNLTELEIFCKTTIDQYEKHRKSEELLPLFGIYIQAFALNHKWSTTCNISIKQLRLLNNKDSVEKIPFFYCLANVCLDSYNYNQLALDFLRKGINITKNISPTPHNEQDSMLNRYSFFQTVHRCNYSLSAKIWKMIIDLRIKNGFISELDHCYSQLLVNNFFAGEYSETISNHKSISELNGQKKTRHYYYTSFWISLAYLMLGKPKLFIKYVLIARQGRHKDPYFRTMRFYCMAHYHIHTGNHYKAYISFKRLLKFYSSLNVNLLIADALLLMLSSKIQYANEITNEDIESAKQAFATECNPNSYNHWSFQMLALTFARYTDEDFGIDVLTVKPGDCPNTLLKQKIYVEKIKLLDHKGMKKEANALREEFATYRKDLELNIPSEYLESWRNTPLFPIP